MPQIETLAATVKTVASQGLTPKQIIGEVRRQHPKASKKDVVRAAFYALTETDRLDDVKSQALHDLAITQRAPGEEDLADAGSDVVISRLLP